jgi:hypothetical protein
MGFESRELGFVRRLAAGVGALAATLLFVMFSSTPAYAQTTEPITPTVATTPVTFTIPSTISIEALSNLTYTLSSLGGASLGLSGGVFEDAERGARSALQDSTIALGDLDGDGQQDAVVIITTTIGESTFVDLAAVLQRDGILVNLPSMTLGDRVQVSNTAIVDGVIRLGLVVHGPDDLLCCPTLSTARAYRLRDGQLVDAPRPNPGRLFPIFTKGRYAYISEFGEMITPAQFAFAGEFSEGMALVSYDGQNFGFIDDTGELVIPPRFLFATPFSAGQAVAATPTNGERLADAIFINRRGENIFDNRTFPFARGFSEGMAAARDESGKFGFIDTRGNPVIAYQYDDALPFSEGLAPVLVGDKVGYIDRRGQMVVDPQYDSAFDFSEGLAAVTVGGLTGYINHRGELVIPPQFDAARKFSGGLAAVKSGNNEAYIDPTGAIIIDALEFTDAHDFSEGLAAVKIGERYGYIDSTGAAVIPAQFTQAGDFQQGVAVVGTADLWGVIRPDGAWLVQVEKTPVSLTPEISGSVGLESNVYTQTVATDSSEAQNATGAAATEIIMFTPQPSPETRSGMCIANSEIVPLPTAWRCGVSGEIYDPCLTAVDGATIVCGADPASGAPGFNLILESPLPVANVPQRAFPGALQFQLESGAICSWNSGDSIQVEGRRVNYICSDLTQLLGEVDQSQPLWTIEEVTLSNDGLGNYRIESSRAVPIMRVWQPQ